MEMMPVSSDAQAVEPLDLLAVRKQVEGQPLLAAPAALRQAVWRVWSINAHLFPDPLPLAAAVGVWVREHKLAEADAADILAGLLRPDRMARCRFASDLMADLAATAATRINRRRQEAETAERRRQAAQAKQAAAAPCERAEFDRWLKTTVSETTQTPEK